VPGEDGAVGAGETLPGLLRTLPAPHHLARVLEEPPGGQLELRLGPEGSASTVMLVQARKSGRCDAQALGDHAGRLRGLGLLAGDDRRGAVPPQPLREDLALDLASLGEFPAVGGHVGIDDRLRVLDQDKPTVVGTCLHSAPQARGPGG